MPSLPYVTTAGRTIIVHGTGIQGATGLTGPAGTPGAFYQHVQAIAAGTWTIIHGINRRVHVTVLNVLGEIVFTDIDQSLTGTVVVTFSIPAAGSAFIS